MLASQRALALRRVPGRRRAHALRRMVSRRSNGRRQSSVIALRRWRESRASKAHRQNSCWPSPAAPMLWLVYNRRDLWQRIGFANGPYSAQGDRAACRRAKSSAPQRRRRSHLFSEIGTVEYGRWKLGPILAGSSRSRARDRSVETAARNRRHCSCLWVPLTVLRVFDRLRFGSAPCPHLVAICDLQPALWTPVAADVCRFRRSAALLSAFAASALSGRHRGNW